MPAEDAKVGLVKDLAQFISDIPDHSEDYRKEKSDAERMLKGILNGNKPTAILRLIENKMRFLNDTRSSESKKEAIITVWPEILRILKENIKKT